MQAPCKNCEHRHINCYSICKSYLEYSKNQEPIRGARVKMHEETGQAKENVKRCKN